MGLVHESSGPAHAEQVARALPVLDDRAVREAVALATAYAGVRHALLALSGISLMHNLGLGTPASLAGVVVSARTAVADARSHLDRPAVSRIAALRLRAALLVEACDLLEEMLGSLGRDVRTGIPRALLERVRRTLSRTSLVEAGMRQFTSVSCARYGNDHDHLHHHAHIQD